MKYGINQIFILFLLRKIFLDSQFEDTLAKTSEQLVQSVNIDTTNLTDSLKLLQEHGITMLQNDNDTNILNTVMESGHSVVLTGK